jgi:hypothetical protein
MRNCAAQCSGVSPVKGDTLPQSALASASAMIVGTSSSAAAMCTACAYRHHVRDDAQDAPITPTITLAHYALALPPNESRRSTLGRGRRSHNCTHVVAHAHTHHISVSHAINTTAYHANEIAATSLACKVQQRLYPRHHCHMPVTRACLVSAVVQLDVDGRRRRGARRVGRRARRFERGVEQRRYLHARASG